MAQTRSSSNLIWNILSYAVLIFLAVLLLVEGIYFGTSGLAQGANRDIPHRNSTTEFSPFFD